MAVVAAFEFDDLVSAGVTSRQADGAHGGFRSGADQPDHGHGGKSLGEHLRHDNLQLRRRPVTRSLLSGLADRLDDLRMAVSEDHGPPGHHIIYVFLTVRINDPGTPRLADKQGARIHGPECPDGAVHPSGDDPLRFFKKCFGQ